MRKQVFMLALVMSFLLTGCKKDDYEAAVEAYDNKKYDVALQTFSNLGDYKDSNDRLQEVLNVYVERSVNYREYDLALDLLDTYGNGEKDKELRDSIAAEAEQYKIYKEACDLLSKGNEDGNYTEGIELLKTLPTNCFNTKDIMDSYDIVTDSKFIGVWRCVAKNPITGTKYKMIITIEPNFSTAFELACNKQTRWADDGTLVLDNDFSIEASRIEENYVYTGKYTWTLDGSGKLIEEDSGSEFVYE